MKQNFTVGQGARDGVACANLPSAVSEARQAMIALNKKNDETRRYAASTIRRAVRVSGLTLTNGRGAVLPPTA